MRMSLVMSMRFIFDDDWNEAPCSIVPVRVVKSNLPSRKPAISHSCFIKRFYDWEKFDTDLS